MGVSVYEKVGRKPVYLVHKVVGRKQYSKTYPLTPEGHSLAIEHDSKLSNILQLHNYVKERSFFVGKRMHGVCLNWYVLDGRRQLAFRLSITVEGKKTSHAIRVPNKTSFDLAFDEMAKRLREIMDIDSLTWAKMRKDLNQSYFFYLNKYNELTTTKS